MELRDLIGQIDILDYISQYTEFEKKNKEYFAVCPFPDHDENTASFSVNTDKQLYYCFGCSHDRGGDVLTFIERYHKLNTIGAIKYLKEYLGISDDVNVVRPSPGIFEMRKMVKAIKPKPKVDFTHIPLDISYLNRFQDWEESPWINEGITLNTIKKYGIKKDTAQERIIIPIWDIYGNLINVSGRAYNPKWKELKQRKYTYYKSMGKLYAIWGYHQNKAEVRIKNKLILVESQKSVMKLKQWGYNNVMALMTSHLSEFQFKTVLELGEDTIFALDKGVRVWEDEWVIKLKRLLNVSYIYDRFNVLEDKEAPCDRGREVWEKIYNESQRRL